MLSKTIQRFLTQEEAATTVEYAVMLMLIVGMCISALQLVGGATSAYWEDSVTELDSKLN